VREAVHETVVPFHDDEGHTRGSNTRIPPVRSTSRVGTQIPSDSSPSDFPEIYIG
jgi:hypothetical protein